MWFLALFSVVGSGVLFALSIFPGLLEQVPDRVALVVGGLFALFAGAATLYHLARPARADRPRQRKSAFVALATLVLTPILLTTLTPRRVVFRTYRPQLEALLTNAPPAGDRSVANLNADLGLYWVDQWGTDAHGGTYFRTLVGVGPDGRSFGFVHRPNADGSPFGDTEYELRHLTGDWYSFAAGDR